MGEHHVPSWFHTGVMYDLSDFTNAIIDLKWGLPPKKNKFYRTGDDQLGMSCVFLLGTLVFGTLLFSDKPILVEIW